MKTKLLCCLALALTLGAVAQPTTDANRRTARAVRTASAPKLDGDLGDECWQNAAVLTDFVSFAPVFGPPGAEKTEVRIVYTDEAIYFGAYLFMKDAALIRTDLNKRDNLGTADQFHIGLDTYHDRQNAFRFEVSAAGVQRDSRMSPNDNDSSWDAVWDSKVKLQADGWSVEIKIPFSAIRFPKTETQRWGIQFARQIQYLNEFDTWSPVDPNGGGAMPQWADLEGIEHIDPPLRLAFSPYLAGSLQHAPDGAGGYVNSRSVNGGMDVKWGLNESFTLDATLIPNFGEVQSDNTVRNLSPFEVQYEERRQFFTEGTELFSKGDLFYSRRIGGTPPGFFNAAKALQPGEILQKNPQQQSLFNATKFSGRTKSKFGIGILNAIGRPTRAVIHNPATGENREFETAGLVNYNIAVFDQALRNNSAVTITNTNVLRNGAARDANVSALSWNLRDKSNTWEFAGLGQLSQVFESGERKTGSQYALFGRKVSGEWGGQVAVYGSDDRYDQNDLGINQRNNYFRQQASISYSNFKPKGKTQYRYVSLTADNYFLNEPRRWEMLEMLAYAETMSKGQWFFSGFILSRPLWYYDFFEPRVWGKQYHHAPFVFFGPSVSSDTRKKLFCVFGIEYGESPIPKDPYIGLKLNPTWVASDHLRLNASVNMSKDHSNFGAVNWQNPENIIFGRRNITAFDNSFSVDYLFSPRMNASVRARHYWAKLYYHEYLHLNDDGSFSPTEWNVAADENFNLFNVDFVYTWQFAPGSFLNLIWKDAIFIGDDRRTDDFLDNWRKTVHGPQDNTFTVKLIYWLDAGRWGRTG